MFFVIIFSIFLLCKDKKAKASEKSQSKKNKTIEKEIEKEKMKKKKNGEKQKLIVFASFHEVTEFNFVRQIINFSPQEKESSEEISRMSNFVRSVVAHEVNCLVEQVRNQVPVSHKHFAETLRQTCSGKKRGQYIDWSKKTQESISLLWKLELVHKTAYERLQQIYSSISKREGVLRLMVLKELLNSSPGLSKIGSSSYTASRKDYLLASLDISFYMNFKVFHYHILNLSAYCWNVASCLKLMKRCLDPHEISMFVVALNACVGLKEYTQNSFSSETDTTLFDVFKFAEEICNSKMLRKTHFQLMMNMQHAIDYFGLKISNILPTKKNSSSSILTDSSKKTAVREESALALIKNKMRKIAHNSRMLPASNIVFTSDEDDRICEKLTKSFQHVFISSVAGLNSI